MYFASFWDRLLAGLIDVLVLAVPSLPITLLMEPVIFLDPENNQDEPLTYFVLAALWACYQGGLESSRLQATLGKLALKIYVVDLRGARLSFHTAAMRCWPMYLGYIVLGFSALSASVFGIKFGTEELMLGFAIPVGAFFYIFMSPKNQGLHDFASGTLVLKRARRD